MASRPILMPKLGLTMTEGVIVEWKIAPGAAVTPGETMFVVETDKIASDVEAPEAGIVEALHAQAGDLVQVGAVVATLLPDSAAQRRPVDRSSGDPRPADPPAPMSPAADGPPRRIATPLARRLARNAAIDLDTITGSGPHGRIGAKDVAAAEASRHAPTPTPAARPAADEPAGEHRPLGAHRKVVARRLTEAKRDIPHFYVFAEADVTALLDLRGALNADPVAVKISVNHFIVTTVARALVGLADANVVWADDGLLHLRQVGVGIAIDTPKGLVAPVLPDIGDATVDEVAQASTRLVERARSGRLGQGDLSGGACSVSNVGMFGATGLLPIVNPGQSSILGAGRAQALFRPDENGQPVLRHILNLTLSGDHRVIDGALAARFLQAIRHGLEAPLSLLRRPYREAS